MHTMGWARVCTDFLPFDTTPCVPDCLNYRRAQRSGPAVATPTLKQDPFVVLDVSTSSPMARQWLQALAPSRRSSAWHPIHLYAFRTHLVSSPLSPSNTGCLAGPEGIPGSSLSVTLSPFIWTPPILPDDIWDMTSVSLMMVSCDFLPVTVTVIVLFL